MSQTYSSSSILDVEQVEKLKKLFHFFADQTPVDNNNNNTNINVTIDNNNSASISPRNKHHPTQLQYITWIGFQSLLNHLGLTSLSISEIKLLFQPHSSRDNQLNNSVNTKNLLYAINFDDFLCLYSKSIKYISANQELREIWRLMDTDLDGIIELNGFRNILIGIHSSASIEGNSKEEAIEKVDKMLIDFFGKQIIENDLEQTQVTYQQFIDFMYS